MGGWPESFESAEWLGRVHRPEAVALWLGLDHVHRIMLYLLAEDHHSHTINQTFSIFKVQGLADGLFLLGQSNLSVAHEIRLNK
jgi:hypothetical protein